ncbi:hypothetical protein DPEC_G00352310 [Dallia pectoralis]|uniref:Uncharacterized protein n=1 Tax=Dallia pectoralis TaxID=75939 RepID=A0ACC2F264_DALPE|nr:hypothetical protein DPEC_G00352310 [Dallia pectoralis]
MEVPLLHGFLGRRRRLSWLRHWRGRYSEALYKAAALRAKSKPRNKISVFKIKIIKPTVQHNPSKQALLAIMSDLETLEDHAKLKEGVIKALECLATISSAAAVINPIFGVAGCLIKVVLKQVDDKDIQNLKREFGSVNHKLETLSRQNRDTLRQIQKETVDGQFSKVEWNLRNQFRKYMEIVEAQPELSERKRQFFEESYVNDLSDQNLHTLYDGVVGKVKLFSRPILQVYLQHSQGDRSTMENLCTRLTYLFCIGLIALMGHSAIIGDDVEGLSEEWAEKMEHVQEKMQEALRKCK